MRACAAASVAGFALAVDAVAVDDVDEGGAAESAADDAVNVYGADVDGGGAVNAADAGGAVNAAELVA